MIANGLPSAVAGMRQRKTSVGSVGLFATAGGGVRFTQWMRWSCQTKLSAAAATFRQRGGADGSADAGTVALAGSRSRLR